MYVNVVGEVYHSPMRHSTRSSERRRGSPLPVVSAAFIVTLMYLIMLGGTRPLEEFGKVLRPHPKVMVWCVLVAAQVAIWSYVATPAYKRARQYIPLLKGHGRSLTFDVIALILLFGIFVYAHRQLTAQFVLPVIRQDAKVPPLNLLGFATLLPCLMGMRLIAIAARGEAAVGVNTKMLDRFAQLRADLKWFLRQCRAHHWCGDVYQRRLPKCAECDQQGAADAGVRSSPLLRVLLRRSCVVLLSVTRRFYGKWMGARQGGRARAR